MTGVSATCILMAKEGFRLDRTVAYLAGAVAEVLLLVIYPAALGRRSRKSAKIGGKR